MEKKYKCFSCEHEEAKKQMKSFIRIWNETTGFFENAPIYICKACSLNILKKD